MGFIAIALLLSSRLIALTVNRSFPPYSAKYLILWCRNPDSNWGPTHYECVALPTELLRQSTISINNLATSGSHAPRRSRRQPPGVASISQAATTCESGSPRRALRRKAADALMDF